MTAARGVVHAALGGAEGAVRQGRERPDRPWPVDLLSCRREREGHLSRTKRTILLLAAIEIFLAGLWVFLANLAARTQGARPDAARIIGEMMGTAMGVVLGLAPFLYLLARTNDRKAAAKKGE
jgi:hypothetical protein